MYDTWAKLNQTNCTVPVTSIKLTPNKTKFEKSSIHLFIGVSFKSFSLSKYFFLKFTWIKTSVDFFLAHNFYSNLKSNIYLQIGYVEEGKR